MHDLKIVWNKSLHKYYFNIIYKISNCSVTDVSELNLLNFEVQAL